MAVDEAETLTEPIITRIGDILRRVNDRDHRTFACCPRTSVLTSEYLVHFFRDHFDTTAAYEYLDPKELRLKGADADRYRSIKRQREEAGGTYCVDDREFWNTRKLFDFDERSPENPDGMNMVILHDYSDIHEQARSIRNYFSMRTPSAGAAEIRFAFNHGSDQLREDRPEFLRTMYHHPDALKAIGRHYPIAETAQKLDELSSDERGTVYTERDIANDSSTTLMKYLALGSAYKKEDLAKHLASQPINDAARVFTALYDKNELFDCLERSHSTTDAIAFVNTHNSLEDAWRIYEQARDPFTAFVYTIGGFGKEAALQYLGDHYTSQVATEIINTGLPESERWDAFETAYKHRIPYIPAERQEAPMLPLGGPGPAPESEAVVYK